MLLYVPQPFCVGLAKLHWLGLQNAFVLQSFLLCMQFTNTRRTLGKSVSHSRRETVVARANSNAEGWRITLDGFSRAALVAGAIAASCSFLPSSAIAVSGGGGQCNKLSLHFKERTCTNGRPDM